MRFDEVRLKKVNHYDAVSNHYGILELIDKIIKERLRTFEAISYHVSWYTEKANKSHL